MSQVPAVHLDLTRLPVNQKSSLCSILDQNAAWEELGRQMKFSEFDIGDVKTEASRTRRTASDVLLTKWSCYGHNVTELFKLLALIHQYSAMEVIKSSVDIRYHKWLKPSSNNIINNRPVIVIDAGSDKQLNGQENAEINEQQAAAEPQNNRTPKEELEINFKQTLSLPEIPIEQLEEATNHWAEANILGKGGFGTVYRAEWLSTKVAIKKLEYRESRSGTSRDYLMQSLNELQCLNTCRHDNILPVYGYSMKDETCLVVYQLMLGGTLEDRLRKKENPPLTWPQRWKIVIGTAR